MFGNIGNISISMVFEGLYADARAFFSLSFVVLFIGHNLSGRLTNIQAQTLHAIESFQNDFNGASMKINDEKIYFAIKITGRTHPFVSFSTVTDIRTRPSISQKKERSRIQIR